VDDSSDHVPSQKEGDKKEPAPPSEKRGRLQRPCPPLDKGGLQGGRCHSIFRYCVAGEDMRNLHVFDESGL